MSASDEAVLTLLLVLLGYLAGNFVVELFRFFRKSDQEEQ